MRRAPFAVILLATSTLLVGQETNVQTVKTATTPKASVRAPAAKPKLTEQQKRGLSLLESAEGAAGGFEAPSRIVAYTQIARVYQTSDKKKAIDLLQQAYDSLQTLQLDSPNKDLNRHVTQQLQDQVLNQFVSAAPERVDALTEQMTPQLRASALKILLPYYEKTKNLDRPVALVMQLGLEQEMPYPIAGNLIDNLGAARGEQVRELFVASLTSYQNHEHDGFSSSDRFTELVQKTFGKVPDDVIATAIDEILSQAHKADEKADGVNVSLGSDSGAVQFKSIYDYRLFAVFPVLEQIDPEKAKRLLKESQDVSTFASKYPQGMNSLSKNGMPNSIMVNTGKSANTGKSGNSEIDSTLMDQQRLSGIMKDAESHPGDALANAAGLSPRFAVSAYVEIARINAKKNTSIAATSLAKAQELIPRVPVWARMDPALDVIRLYIQMNDTDSARKAVESATKILTAVYKQETDAEDPNTAPKAYWLSTNAWRNLVEVSYQLDSGEPVSLLKEIPDDEIRVFTQISLAKRLLGVESSGWDYTMMAGKNGTMMTSVVSRDQDNPNRPGW